MTRTRQLMLAVAICAALVQNAACGAVSVTASKEYVDRKTTLHANTNATGEVVGYYLGTQTGINLQPQGNYVKPADGEKTDGNLAKWGADGKIGDSGAKPSDFATAAQGAKADTAVQPEDLPEKLPNPKALKFLASSGGTNFTSYDGSEEKVIDHATNNKFGLCRLTDALDSTSAANTGLGASAKAVKLVNDKVTAIEDKIPPQASASNQLADKAFVNSSIATETATFRGTFNLVTDLQLPLDATHEQVAAAVKTKLGQTAYDKNDYVFVQIPQDAEHTDAIKQVDRYKCVETGTDPVVKSWEYEWTLNNSSFTAAQWAAINSGITSGGVAKLDGIAAGAQVNVVETVKVNGTALTPTDKAVDIRVPTQPSDIGAASTADVMLNERGFSEWTLTGPDASIFGNDWTIERVEDGSSYRWKIESYGGLYSYADNTTSEDATELIFTEESALQQSIQVAATRTALQGYDLGAPDGLNAGKPLASEAEAEALRQGKQDALTFDSMPKNESTNPVTSDGIHSALTSSTIVNRDMRNLKVAGLPASGTGYFVFRTSDNFDYREARWDSSRSMWMITPAGVGVLGLRTTSNPEVYEAIFRDLRGTVTHISDLDFAVSDTLSFVYDGKAYTVFGVTDDILARTAGTGHAGNLAVLDAQGNPTDSLKSPRDFLEYWADSADDEKTAVTIGIQRGQGTVGKMSFVQGYLCVAEGNATHAQGDRTTAKDTAAHAEGSQTEATAAAAHAEGGSTKARGTASHSEGLYSKATGIGAHAEGSSVDGLAQGVDGTDASGSFSHTEGLMNAASGMASHAQGFRSSDAGKDFSFVWQGYGGDVPTTNQMADLIANGPTSPTGGAQAIQILAAAIQGTPVYNAKHRGSFCVNPVPASGSTDPKSGFFVGTESLDKVLRYSFNAATISSGATPAVANLADRAINTVTLGPSVTAAGVTLPTATAGYARDFYLDLTVNATNSPTLTFTDPATGAAANFAFGADSLAVVGPGANLVHFTELPGNRWLVDVRH